MMEGPSPEIQRAVFRPLREGNSLEDAIARLMQTIRLGLVPPGGLLPSERELADRYEISRDTVREALSELASAGYVERRRGRYGGTFIVDPLPAPTASVVSATALGDVLGLRRVIEAGAVRAVANRQLSSVERAILVGRLEAVSAADPIDYRRMDTLLHLALVELARIPSLIPLAVENRAQVNVWLDMFPLLPLNIGHSNDQHRTIVKLTLGGQAEPAVTAILEHLAGSEALVRGFLA